MQLLRTHIPLLFLIIAFIGFADASYLTAKHYNNEAVTCSLTQGCEAVTTSSYATIGPVPVALLGALYYLTIVLGSAMVLDTKNTRLLRMLSLFTSTGFLASVYFVALQLFVIKAICLYCMGSALTSTLLFALGIYTYRSPHD